MARINDYELIYLIQNEKDEHAFSYMVKQYRLMIWKFIHLYQVRNIYHDDYFQEGLALMYKAIEHFQEYHNKTFTRYFELILKRHFIRLKSKTDQLILHENLDRYVVSYEASDLAQRMENELTSDLEKDLFVRYFVENASIEFLAKEFELTSKQIYNTIYRIRKKLKKML